MTKFVSALCGGTAVAMVCAVAFMAGEQPQAAPSPASGELVALVQQIERLADSFERIARRESMRAAPAPVAGEGMDREVVRREAVAVPAAAAAPSLDASGIVEQLRGLRLDLRTYGRGVALGESHLRYGSTRVGAVQAFLQTCQSGDNAHNALQLLTAEDMLKRFGRPTRCQVNQAGAMYWRYENGQKASFSVTFYDGVVMDVEYYVPD